MPRPSHTTPIAREDLRRLVEACDPATLAGCRDAALLTLGWAIAAGRSELAALRVRDVRFQQPGAGQDVFQRGEALTKVARYRQAQASGGVFEVRRGTVGEWVRVPTNPDPVIDPGARVCEWLTVLDDHQSTHPDQPLFRAITRGDRLYRHNTITADAINYVVQRAVHRARLPHPERYSSRSLQLGGRMGQAGYGTSGGVELTDEVIERYAQAAEEGYDVDRLRTHD